MSARTLSIKRLSIWQECTPQANGCVYWAGPVNSEGYGKMPTWQLAQRTVFERLAAPIPLGWVVDHVCHSRDLGCPGGPACLHRRCINLLHLELVPERENLLRGRSFAAVNARKTDCGQGHAFDEENTYRYSRHGRQYRVCRACNRAAVAAYKRKRRQGVAS